MTIAQVGMQSRRHIGPVAMVLALGMLADSRPASAGMSLIGVAAGLSDASLVQIPIQRRALNLRRIPANRAQQQKQQQAGDAQVQAVEDAIPGGRILTPLLQKLFNPNPAGRGRTAEPAPGEERDGHDRDRDLIDSRAPHDVKVEQIMGAAESAIRRKEWKTAQDLLQRLLDLPEDSLYRQADGRWQSVRRSANQLLGSAPRQFLEDYRTQYSGLAQQLLNEARRTGRTADYVNVATRFLHTPAGYEAANYLGSLHLDRGEFGLAAAWFDEIARASAALSADGAWRVKAALANRQAGDVAASQKLLKGLTEPAGQRVNLGLGGVEPESWVGGTTAALPGRELMLGDWLQLYGSAARLGTSAGSEPLLAPLWTVPLSSSHLVRRRLDWILQDLVDQDKSPVMAAVPLAVNGRVIYRDLRGVRAVDIDTGKTVWESLEGTSPERILAGLPPQTDRPDAWRFRMQLQNEFNEYQGQSAEYHPLASLLFRDGVFGLVSSDGQQVFVIEDHGILSRNQPGQHWGWDGSTEPQDPYGVPWRTNRLVSYDLATGRPRWSIGGAEAHESFDLPLAGSYFYGVPAVDGEELLVVAGKGDDVRLWSLDRATGTPRWSQLIAYTDTKIEQDIGRRWYTAQVAADGGVIVCPTTVGWLVAVDRLRQSVLWAYRYVPPSGSQVRETGLQFVPQRDLSSQWLPSAPVIAGNTVVYTPPEESIVVALNLLDGRRLWEKPKETWMYLAGVFGDRVVLVGGSEVGAFELSTGNPVWTAALGNARPSGRGQVVQQQFYLPLNDGELRVIDLKSGKTVSHGFVPPNHPPLGNLATHRGKLVALGPQGLVGFGQRDAVLAEIQRRKNQDPQDPWALLREAEIQLLNREHAAALPLLKASGTAGLTVEEQARRHAELVECLAVVIRRDPRSHSGELEELGRLAATPQEKRLHQELTADSLVAQARFLEAFEVLWSLRDWENLDTPVVRGDDPQVSLAPHVWLSGRLRELWTASSGMDREHVDTRITAAVASATAANPQERRQVALLLGFHPAATVLRESMVEELASARDFAGAQLELLKLASGADRELAARATARLARLMEQFELPADAAWYYQSLERDFGDVKLRDGETGSDLVRRLQAEGKIARTAQVRRPAWDDRPLQLIQGPVQYTPPTQEITLHSMLPYYEPLTVEVRQQEQRLAFEFVANGQYSWLAPLKSSPRNQGDGYAVTEFLGHEVVVINRDVVHVFSPVEKRLLWSRTLDGSGEGGPFWRHASRPPQLAMVSSRNADQPMSLLQLAGYTGRLAVVQPDYLCVYGRRSITVMDPRTGEFLWRKDGIPQYSQVVGNRDMLCVVPQDREKAVAYRATDGKVLQIDHLGTLLGNTLQMRQDSLLLLEQGPAFQFPLWNLVFNSAKCVVRLYQPTIAEGPAGGNAGAAGTGRDLWKVEYSPGSLIAAVDRDELLVVSPDGKVERLDADSGQRRPLESIPPGELKSRRMESYALADDDHIYFVANSMDTAGFHHYGESLPSVRANGKIYAWTRSDGKLAWSQEIKNQNLVVDRFRSLPVLLFVSRSWKQKGNMSYGTLSVQVIHKKTGKVLHNSPEMPSMYSGFHSLDVNLSEPSIELRSYNLRMRLVPGDGPVAAAKPAAPVQPATKN